MRAWEKIIFVVLRGSILIPDESEAGKSVAWVTKILRTVRFI